MLSKSAEYALRAVVYLGREAGQVVNADELARVTRVPRRYLHKVLQDLGRGGLLRSQPGPSGGYSLARPADEVSILDVVNAVAPLERIRHCPLGLVSHQSLCPLHHELDKAYAATEAAFARVTIGALLRSTSPVVPLCEFSPS